MSISPVQLMLQVTSAQNTMPTRRSSQSAALAANQPQETSAESANSAAAAPPPDPYSTDMKVDDQHQVYYEVVDNRTGDELFEIPPEVLRKIGESLNVPLIGESSVHRVDIKS